MAAVEQPTERKVIVKEMSWDPITRIVGSLGIHTEIDFTNQHVLKCYSTSMVFRGFDIGNPTKDEADRAYAGRGDYKALQDYIFRFLAAECGRLGMAVHIHCSASAGGYFDIAGDNPLLLEPLLHDPAMRKTNFVLLHGGWPFTGEITAMLENPNVYLDYSEQTFTGYPREVASNLRKWLEYEPEKVLFATDAYPFSKEIGWEEAGYIAAKTGREALGIALTGMLRDEEISRDRALELARMVLRENARKLYSF